MPLKPLVALFALLLAVGLGAVALAGRLEGGHSHDDAGNAALFDEPVDQTVRLTMADLSFTPTAIRAKRDSLIEIAMENVGVIDHDFTIMRIDVDQAVERTGEVPAAHQHMDAYDVHVALGSKQSARLRLHLHHPGTYTYICTVPGHEAAGMRGTLVVE